MKKEYFNQEAYNYIASQINKTKINAVFKPIVIDIMLRRRHEYQLNDNYFHRDVESFIRNVDEIYCEDLPDKNGGDFYPKKRCIRINRKIFTENMNDEQFAKILLEVISHECGHAMNFDETRNDRTFKIDPTDIADSTIPIDGILEIFTEKEADRIVCNRKFEDAFNYYNDTIGYKYTTNYVNAIAMVFGIREKELLSAAIKGEQELYEALNVNIKNEKFSQEKFKNIAFNIRIIHKELYKDKDDEICKGNLGHALIKIYEELGKILAYRIDNLEWDNLENLKVKLEEIKLSQNAISKIMPLEKVVKKENVEELTKLWKRMVYAKIMSMEQIIKNKGKHARELINFVQNSGSIDDILEFMKQNGIEINSKTLALMPEFELSQEKKEEWAKEFCLDGEKYDNTEVIAYIIENRKKIKKVKERVSFDKIKSTIMKPYIMVNKILTAPFMLLWKTSKRLWKALPQKKNILLLGERRKRKKRKKR